jgi:hypothetical protein
MKEFKCSRGHTFAFGRDMWNSKDDPGIFSWNDPISGSWIPSIDNEAGTMALPVDLGPEPDVREDKDRNIILADRFKIKWIGKPLVWGIEEIHG